MSRIIEHRSPVTFSKGEPIFVQGSAADVSYWVISGLVKVYFPLEDGTRVIVHIAGGGDFIGIVDGMGPNGRHMQALEAEAMTKVSVAIFTREHVLSMLKTMPPAGLVALMQDVNTAWSQAFSWCARFLGLPFRDRLLSTFEYLAGRHGVRESRGILLTLELSHDDLAEMIASSRPMVSRLIAEFIEHGELARQGRHYIVVDRAVNSSPQNLPAAGSKALRAAAREHAVGRVEPLVNRPTMRSGPVAAGATLGDSSRLRAANNGATPGREYVK
jgi:CRP/FNR family transcriptional regulator